ncbi:MAG: glycerophosphodiester phosphodiesterase [bacterium]
MKKTLIVAHRGASAYAHENTIDAFRIAIEMNADMIETDVRRTADEILVLHHDEYVGNRLVRELTFAEASTAALEGGYILPALEETLQHIKGKIKLDLELKETGYELDVADMAAHHLERDEFVMTSFKEPSVRIIKENRPDLTCGLLMNISLYKRPGLSFESVLSPIRRQKRCKADFLLPHWEIIKFGFLNRIRKKTRPVFVWTVNDRKMIRKLLDDEMVSGIVTDHPDIALFLRETSSGADQ